MGMTPQYFHTIPTSNILLTMHTTKLSTYTLDYSHNELITAHQKDTTAHSTAFCIQDNSNVCYAQYHPQYNSLSMHVNICTTHPALTTPLPSIILNKHKAYSWQNGTQCKDGCKRIVASFASCLAGF